MSHDELTILFIAIGITLTVAMCFLFVFALRLYHMKVLVSMDSRNMENIESDSYLSPISYEILANELEKKDKQGE
uniref:DUF3951 domain-containing protein n=1 Tax=Ascaris lumbricoides TaxID=6252 RepID=A0A0M3I206_ASCLU